MLSQLLGLNSTIKIEKTQNVFHQLLMYIYMPLSCWSCNRHIIVLPQLHYILVATYSDKIVFQQNCLVWLCQKAQWHLCMMLCPKCQIIVSICGIEGIDTVLIRLVLTSYTVLALSENHYKSITWHILCQHNMVNKTRSVTNMKGIIKFVQRLIHGCQ